MLLETLGSCTMEFKRLRLIGFDTFELLTQTFSKNGKGTFSKSFQKV